MSESAMTDDAMVGVTAEDLIRLRLSARRITLVARTPVSSVIAGVHASRFRGRGVDFVESRNYEVGDDIRDLDWRVTARTGKPHTKVFQEERERPVLVILDSGPSMYFATQGVLKVVQAARLAALLGWTAIRRGDRIGALIFDDAEHHEVRPAGGRRGVLRLISVLVNATREAEAREFERPQPRLDEALKRARRIARPGSLIFVVSDFYGMGDQCERHLAYLKRHSDVVACRIRDPLEIELPPQGTYPVSDGHTQGVLDLRRRQIREQYEAFIGEHHERYVSLCNKHGIARLDMRTTDDPTDVLSRLFRVRDVA